VTMSVKNLIELHISGRGSGFEIDDIISCGKYSELMIGELEEIEKRYRSSLYKIGTSNPSSFEDLRDWAKKHSTS